MSEDLFFVYLGTRVRYRRIGAGKPMLFLHGWGVDSDTMMPLASHFSGEHSCILPDFPGFGLSEEPPVAWTVDDYAGCIHALLRDLEVTRTDVIAHSFGGRVMLKLCSRPDTAVLFDKVLITGGAGMKPRRPMTFYLKKYFAKTLKAPFVILPGTLREKGLNRLRQTSLWRSLGSSDYSKLSGVMRETFVKSVSEFLESCLPEIENEVLLLWGKNDDSTPLYQAQRMEAGIRNAALVVIDDAGHYAFIDQPAKFRMIAQAFLGSE
jgi:pimeloyl-ACP methyl ester carboxylesterase